MSETGTYHFKLNGEFLTKFLREIAIDDLVKAIDIGMNDIGLSYQQAFNVCVGQMKLCGTGLLYLEHDNESMIYGKYLYKTGAEKLDVNIVGIMALEKTPFKI